MFGIVQVQGLPVKETRYLRRSSGRGFPGVSGSRHQDAFRPRDAGRGSMGPRRRSRQQLDMVWFCVLPLTCSNSMVRRWLLQSRTWSWEARATSSAYLGAIWCVGGYSMARLLIMLDPGAGVKPADVAAAWNADDEASAAGLARAETASGSEYLPGVMELIAIPLA